MTYQQSTDLSSQATLPPEVINTIDKAVFSSRPLKDVLIIILDAALDLLKAEHGTLRRVDRKNQTLILTAYRLQENKSITSEGGRDLALSQNSVMAVVARTGKPQRLGNIQSSDAYHQIDPNLEICSELAVPLLSDDGTVVTGVLNVESPRLNAFTEQDQELLVLLAKRAQVAIQRAMLADKIYQISQKLLTTSVQELLDYTVEAVSELIQVPVCTLWLWDESSGALMERAAVGRELPQFGDPDYQIGPASFIGQVLTTKAPLTSPNIQTEDRFIHTQLAKKLKLTSALIVPLLSPDQKILGTIALYATHEPRKFTEHEQNLTFSFANQIAVRLEQARLLREQKQNLRRDASLRKVGNALATAPNLYALLQAILQEAIELLEGSGAILYFQDEKGMENKIVAATGTAKSVEGMTAPPDDSLGGWVIEHNQAVHCPISDPRVAQKVAQETKASYVVAVPLLAEGVVIGSLIILDHQCQIHKFNAQDAELLEILAPHATAAINRMRHYERTQRNSTRLAVINDVLMQSVQAGTVDIESLLQETALAIQEAFGYRVDIGIKQADRLLFKAVASYLGQKDKKPWTAKFTKGITGAAFSSGKTIVLDDITSDSRYDSVAKDTRSELAIPLLLASQEPIGVLNIESQELNAFADPKVQQVFESIAATLTMVIEKARRLKELEALNEITKTINAVGELSVMAESIVKKVVELFEAQAGRLFLTDEANTRLDLIYHIGADKLARRTKCLRRGESIAGKVLATGKTIFSRNMVKDPLADSVARSKDNIRSLIDVPIWADKKILGVLAVLNSDERTYTQLDIQILEAIGRNIGMTIERVRLSDRSYHLYQNAPDPILILDLEGLITDMNPATTELTGYMTEELKGTRVVDLISNDSIRNRAANRIQRMTDGEELPMMEITVRCANETELAIESNPTVVKDGDGETLYIQAHWRNITPRKRQEEFLRELTKISRQHHFKKENLLTEMIQHVIQVMESDDCYIHLVRSESDELEPFVYPQSPYINQIHGYSLKIGEGIVGSVAKEGQRKIMSDIQSTDEYKYTPFIPPHLRQDIIAVPMRTKDRIIGTLSVLRYGDTIVPYNQADGDRLESLADTLSLALEIRRLNENQSRQLAAQTILEQVNIISAFATHRLGNIIPPMNMTVRELRRTLATSSAEMEELMAALEEKGGKAVQTINLFRDMGLPLKQDPVPIHLPTIVEIASRDISTPANIKVLFDQMTELPCILAQEDLLIDIIQGIIQNAIEAMDEGGQLSISGTLSREKREVRLRFTNTGRGIPTEIQENIFEPFFTTKRERAGIGLGLWLSRLYLRSIGGDIEMYSKSAHGTNFTLHLPVTQQDLLPQPLEGKKKSKDIKIGSIDSTQDEKRILIVDDLPDFPQALRYPLQRAGFTIYTAESRQEAEALINGHTFQAFVIDIRLVDYSLDNKDGIELVEQICLYDRDIPILLISAYPEYVEEAKRRFSRLKNVVILNKTDSQLEEVLQQLAEQNRKENNHDDNTTAENFDRRGRTHLANQSEILAGMPCF